MRTLVLDKLAEILPDEKTTGRNPGSPGFIFKSDPKSKDEEYAARLIERFEEWKAEKYGPPEIDEDEKPIYELIQVKNLNGAIERGEKLKKLSKRRVTLEGFFEMSREEQDACEFENEIDIKTFLSLPKAIQKKTKIWTNRPEMVTYSDLQDARRRLNWFIGWAKRTPKTNDAWHRIIAEIGPKLADEEGGEEALSTLISELRKRMKFAPGPIMGTIFRNPDGSTYRTAGVSMTTAKKAFQERHKLQETFVSVDRIQKIGERGSMIVVGTRRTSDQTLSHYYDPQPEYTEKIVNGEIVKSYRPKGDSTIIFMENGKLPEILEGEERKEHILTIREYEQAIIAGAEVLDSSDEFEKYEDDEDVTQIEETGDDRELWINMGMGKAHKTIDALSEEEQEIHQILTNFGETEAAEFMLIPKIGVEAELALEEMNAFFRSSTYLLTENAIEILQWTARNRKELLPFMKQIIIGRETEKASR